MILLVIIGFIVVWTLGCSIPAELNVRLVLRSDSLTPFHD